MAGISLLRRPSRLAATLEAFFVPLLAACSGTPASEVARNHSPNGLWDAVLLEIPMDAAGRRGIRVCLESKRFATSAAYGCAEVAYLSGVGENSTSVYTIWNTSTDLRIHYSRAVAVHLYRSVYSPGGYRGGQYAARDAPIVIRLVKNDG
jgi:hypothetical protein